MKKFIIITTINKKTRAIKKFANFKDWQIVLVGDKKSKKIKSNDNVTFLSVEDQQKLKLKLLKHCPYNHYARKNIGYLYAIKMGAEIIYDTDDDNIPYDNWKFPDFKTGKHLTCDNKFFNIYKYFTDEKVWPRGYPLDEINKISKIKIEDRSSKKIKIGAWQGMADTEPDVDAIFRLTENKKIIFEKKEPITLNKKIYCPFNSQNTLWNREVFPYLYLPSTVSFRFTDILRGYIAQRLFWEDGYNLGFTKATVYQERNVHNLMDDFKGEIPVFLQTKKLIKLLDEMILVKNSQNNIIKIYETLLMEKIIKNEEIKMIKAWINDLNNLL